MNPKHPTLKLFLVAFVASMLSAIVLGVGEARLYARSLKFRGTTVSVGGGLLRQSDERKGSYI